ncbi:MAG: UDPGP type 1 family protein [Planctomycetaceae bacterium]|nr:UDPGP type 1 family protein [Planctomycetaceae bacterium]
MTGVIDKAQLEERLRRHNQLHLLRFWDELNAEGQRQLAQQIMSIDFDLLDSLFRDEIDQPDWAELARQASPPPAVRLHERKPGATNPLDITVEQARRAGVAALEKGEVGVILVAGGQGSRLGFEKPKGMYPIGPLSKATLAQIHVEKIRAIAARHGKSLPLYMMTSPVTHDDTLDFLGKHAHLGLNPDDLFVFCQGTMPAVDAKTGQVLLEAKDSIFLSPDGHGGTVAALGASGAFDDMRRRGIKHLFYFQVDNPLAPICDAELIGFHILAKSELTSLAVAKQTPQERLGNFVMINDRVSIIEYSDFPDDVAEQRDEHGELVFWAGSVAIHVFDVAFLERALQLKDTLPFHVAHKKAEYLGDDGELVKPTEPNALKFERFIFDLLPHAARPIVIEYAEEEAFAPLKNAPGAAKDTPEYVHELLLNQHRRWLEAAGAHVAPGAQVEISPLFALDAAEVAERVKPGTRFEKSEYLRGK